jgi:hypothetical protein
VDHFVASFKSPLAPPIQVGSPSARVAIGMIALIAIAAAETAAFHVWFFMFIFVFPLCCCPCGRMFG